MSSILQNITPASIRWFPDASPSVELHCPVCGMDGPKSPLLETASMADSSLLTLYSCPDCGSKLFDPPGINDFSDIHGTGTHFWKSYVEVMGGIWEMYWPPAVARKKSDASLLDVGCGFGFTTDAWRRLHGAATGVELAEYGRLGAQYLDLPIYSDYLQNIAALKDKRFDVVYASEVIEHVPDPREFAALLSRFVADDGVLCLTTPNADSIKQQNDGPTLLAALSPGFHGFLIGPAEMKRMLHGCGFEHVAVREYGERQIAWASQRPLNINQDNPRVRAEYLRYLDQILETRQTNDVVTDGIAYRRVRDSVLVQDFEAAGRCLTRLEASLDEKYSAAWRDPERTTERVLAFAAPDEYDPAFPWFLPNLYYLRGIYAKLSERDEQSARRYFRASRHITAYIASAWGISFVLEALSFVPEAWQQEAVSAALAGDASVCEEWIGRLVDSGYQNLPEIGGGRLTNRQIEQAYLEALSILSALKRPESLATTLHQCLKYLDQTYGTWISATPDAQVPLPGDGLLHEQRMYLHFKLAAACLQFGSHGHLVQPLLERVIQLGAMQAAPSQMAGWIVSEARAKLVSLAPRPAAQAVSYGTPKPAVSYAFNLGPKKNP